MPFVDPDSIRRFSSNRGAGWGDQVNMVNMIQWMLKTEKYPGSIELIYTKDTEFKVHQLVGRLLIDYPQQLRLIAYEQFLQDFTEKRVPPITFSFFAGNDVQTHQFHAKVSIAFSPFPNLSTTTVTLSILEQSKTTRISRTLGETSMGGIVPSVDVLATLPVSLQQQKPAVAQLLTAWDSVHTKAIYGCNVIFSGLNMGQIVLNEVLALKRTQALEPDLWDKPIVICLLNTLSGIDRRKVAKAVTGEAFFISQNNPNFLEMLETHHRTGDVFILDVGTLPKDIFEAITVYSTFPPSLEGANQFRLVLDAQKPCIFVMPWAPQLPFLLPRAGEAAQQLLTASIATSASDKKGFEDSANQVEALAHYYRTLRDPNSAMSRYWQALFDQQQLAPSRYQVALELARAFVQDPILFTSQNQTVSFSDPIPVVDTQKDLDFLAALQQQPKPHISSRDINQLLHAANIDFLTWLLQTYEHQITPLLLLQESLYWEIHKPETFTFIVKLTFNDGPLSCDDMSLDVLNIALINKDYPLTQWLLEKITTPLVEPRPFKGFIHAVYHQWPDVIRQLRTLGLRPASHHETVSRTFSDKHGMKNPRLLPTPTLFPKHNYALDHDVNPVGRDLLLSNELEIFCDAARQSGDCELHVGLLSTASKKALATFCSEDDSPQEPFCHPDKARWQVMPEALTPNAWSSRLTAATTILLTTASSTLTSDASDSATVFHQQPIPTLEPPSLQTVLILASISLATIALLLYYLAHLLRHDTCGDVTTTIVGLFPNSASTPITEQQPDFETPSTLGIGSLCSSPRPKEL